MIIIYLIYVSDICLHTYIHMHNKNQNNKIDLKHQNILQYTIKNILVIFHLIQNAVTLMAHTQVSDVRLVVRS